MKAPAKYPALCLLASMLLVASCSREEFLTPVDPSSSPLTVSEAKTWMLAFLREGTNSSQPYATRELVWGQAVVKKTNGGLEYVQVPIEDDKKFKNVIYDYVSKVFVPAPKLQATLFKDKNGAMQLQLMELIPTGEYAYEHQGFTIASDYSGIQLLRSWEGKFIKGNKFENGRLVGLLNQIGNNVNVETRRARVQGCERWVQELIFIGCIRYDGEFTSVGSTTFYPQGSPSYPQTPDQSSPLSYQNCSGGWQSNGTFEYEICSAQPGYDPYNPPYYYNPSDPFNPVPASGPLVVQELFNNRKGLYGPCPGLTDRWLQQINFRSVRQISEKLARMSKQSQFPIRNYPGYSVGGDWYVQSISSAVGTLVNLDNFSVFMTDLPIVNGQRLSVSEFANYIRINLNSFVDPSKASFIPHPLTGENESAIWQSSNATGAVMYIDIGTPSPYIPLSDDGVIIVSEVNNGYESAGWTFSTIYDPFLGGDHPVSGTRTFSLYETSGGYIFSTQAADRLTNYLGQFTNVVTNGLPFTAADELWMSMQTKVSQFVNSHGETAQILTPITNRPNWSGVKKAMDENRSLSTIPCN